MNIGSLRNRITVQNYTITYNDLNEEIKTWADFVTVWAEVMINQGREFWGAKKLNAELSGIIKIRFNHDITELMRIPYDGQTYQITAVIHDIKKAWTELHVKVVK
jgi:SPP1 family predicted phage head-tail adaptor